MNSRRPPQRSSRKQSSYRRSNSLRQYRWTIDLRVFYWFSVFFILLGAIITASKDAIMAAIIVGVITAVLYDAGVI